MNETILKEDIMVSVFCLTYNQEKYIRQCLDGILNQDCPFKYEVFVHDDASTDGTADIVREYAERYPNLIIPIIQTENQYSKGVSALKDFVLPKIHGKYIAQCEGDDYWIDSEKLKKQVNVLENNIDCQLCLHRVMGVSQDENPNGIMYPNFLLNTGIFSGEQLLDYICTNEYVFQTTSYFARSRFVKDYYKNLPIYKRVAATGDTPFLLYFSLQGNVYYIDEVMSCYRHTDLKSNPRKAKYLNTEERIVAHYNKQIRMMEEFDKYTERKYHRLCQRKIDGYHFDKAVRNKDYKELCHRKYDYFKKDWSVKEKIKTFLLAYFPWVLSFRRNNE